MGKRGRLPMHPHLRLLKGSPGGPGRAKPPIEAAIPDELPTPPAWLSAHALEQWHSVAPELYRCGLLTTLDLMPFASWCVAAARWKSASEALAAIPEAERLVVRGKVNPLVRIAHTAADEMQKLGAPFGLSGPGSRQRLVGVVKQAPGKFHGLIGGDEPA